MNWMLYNALEVKRKQQVSSVISLYMYTRFSNSNTPNTKHPVYPGKVNDFVLLRPL